MDYENLSYEEKFAFVKKARAAAKQGDFTYAKMIPLAPSVAWAAKETWGKDCLEGWNLSRAESEYGKNWLSEPSHF